MTPDTFSRATLSAAALRVVERFPATQVHAAWVSGSLVEGLGNPSSDVDIFVAQLGETPSSVCVTRQAQDHGILAFVEGDIRYDVEFWSTTDIEKLAAKLDELPIDDPARNNLHFLSYWETEFVNRLLVGVPIVHEARVEALRDRFDASRFARFLMDTAVRRADDAFDDAVGMLGAAQLRAAALRVRDAIGFSVDALLYAHGITNDKPKFRLHKLERMVANGHAQMRSVLDSLWQFESCIPGDDDGLRRYVEEGLRYSSVLIDRATKRTRGSLQ